VLNAAAKYVKPGGRMLYATCSFLIEEDEDRVNAFLEAHPGWVQEDAVAHVVESDLLTDEGLAIVKAGQGPDGSVRLTPRTAGTDGFFFATLRCANKEQ
jgi:16S rRNA (cytosine967-C5)-methyltransferase